MKERTSGKYLSAVAILAALFMLIISAKEIHAAETGWKTSDGSVYYYKNENGTAVKLTGYQKVKKFHYYFNSEGILQTGWVKTEDGIRYFRTDGSYGKLGRQFTSLHEINGRLFGFP